MKARNIILNNLTRAGIMVIAILLFIVIQLDAQEKVKVDENQTAKNIKTPNSTQTTGDTVSVKDENGNVLMTVTDEGTAGSIKLNDAGAVTPSTNKLYNNGGSLYWNGSALGSGSGASQINDLSDAKYDGSSLFIGEGAGINDDGTSNGNTAIGKNTLKENTTGHSNIAVGLLALSLNTTGSFNTGNGFAALYQNSTGEFNIATGYYSLYNNVSGSYNSALGSYALYLNTTGNNNTAMGYSTLNKNTTGFDNTATGYSSLYNNTSGYSNTAFGKVALYNNTTGYANTAIGKESLFFNTIGVGNVGIGIGANYYNAEGSYNTVIGYQAGVGTSGINKSGNVFLGYKAGYFENGSNKLYIQNDSATAPLIWGDFALDSVKINGNIEVANLVNTSQLRLPTNAATGYVLTSDSAGNATWQISSATTSDNDWTISGTNLYSTQTGNVGIGTSTPTTKLEIIGKIKTSQLQVVAGATSGYVLTSDVSGNATWQAVPGGSGGGATQLDDLTDAKTDVESIFLGSGAGENDSSTVVGFGNKNTAVGINALKFNTTGQHNVSIGFNALYSNTTGINNAAIGSSSLYTNTTGSYNTALGKQTFYLNTTGSQNTALGFQALYSNTIGTNNFAGGYQSLLSNTDGGSNIAIGNSSLKSNTTGNFNTAIGHSSLNSNISGRHNVASGYQTLGSNTIGENNTGIGSNALKDNTEGNNNIAIGKFSLPNNTIGNYNTAVGTMSLQYNTTGEQNTAVGGFALNYNSTGIGNVGIGHNANLFNQGGSYNTIIGFEAGAGGGGTFHNKDRNIFIGYKAGYDETGSNKLYIENSSSTIPLIWGDFAADSIKINGDLEVLSKLKTNLFTMKYGAINGYVLTSDANGKASWQAPTGGSDNDWTISGNDLYSNQSGNVGIGTVTPSVKLEVNGKTKTSQLQITTGAINGYILTSDANGNATWALNSGGANSLDDLSDAITDINSVYLGSGSGANNSGTNNNVGIGINSLNSNTTGNQNSVIGKSALSSNTTGHSNTVNGFQSMLNNIDGHSNTSIGANALYNNTIGIKNVAVGLGANYSNQQGSFNTMLGYQAGRGTAVQKISGNVFLGYKAGYFETGNNKLYINNDSSSSPLIWGDFSTNKIVINGNASNNSNNRTFLVNGDAGGKTAWFNDSDRRLKKNITTIGNALEKVNKLRGVNYQWKDSKTHSAGLQMGFIAQEAEEVIPEVVDNSGDHYSMQYAPVTALLVEAVKEQNSEFRSQNSELKGRIKKLEEENEKLKTVVQENNELKKEIKSIKAVLNKLVSEKPAIKVSKK